MNNNNYDSYLNNASDFPLTLEWHLQRMAERASHDPRYKQLCLIWEKTKNFLAGILSHNNAQYYTYSFHDASHSAAVVANIEQILGDRRIAKLSATDTFMILFTCYMHDIGMAIMQSDLNDLCENKNQEIEAELEKDKEANQFFSKLIQAHKKNDFNGVNDCLKQFVCDYICGMPYANLLLSNVFRGNHGANSLNVLKKIICGSNDTSNVHKVAHIVFDDLALPIIEHAGMICKLHTVPRQNREKALEEIIKDIKDYRQSGYCGDHYHPRFVAVLLQLGDLMDLGSSRYDVLYEMYYGKRDGLSKIHFDKHQAIEGALVDADKIRYSANATSVEALRLLHNETEWINAVLKFAATHWGEIAPKNFEGNLPTFILDPLKLNGEVIPDKLVSQEFVIEQKRAFELLKGSNIYETHFTFVREFIQNAFDATMLQCWREYKQRHPNCDPNALHLNSLTTEICKDIAKYSVCVSFHFCKEVGDKYYYVTEDDLKDYVLNKERPREFKTRFGLLVCISDHGIGISEEDLSIISEIGTSYNEKKAEIAAMPSFLKPSGTFGVGMQSAFKQCDRFFATTCAVESKAWEIEFTPLSGSRKGCISAVPIKGGSFPKGTTFKVFLAMDDPNVVVPVDKIALWAGDCTFSDNFEQYYPLKKAEALAHY
ncbi:MAG: hypothetical protein LBB91_03385, partial [Clostridiales bacterium]|nr:hypothetical protein [Clostridiales bacterium]